MKKKFAIRVTQHGQNRLLSFNPALPLMLTSAAATPVQNGQNALSGTLLDQGKTCNIKVGQNFTLFL